jgi:hypothetical protein
VDVLGKLSWRMERSFRLWEKEWHNMNFINRDFHLLSIAHDKGVAPAVVVVRAY